VDFDLNEEQRAVLEAVANLLDQYAGPARAIELQAQSAKDGYDGALDAALREAGFSEIARSDDFGELEAALTVEAVARAGGVVSIGAEALVAPAVSQSRVPGPIALAFGLPDGASEPPPVRYGSNARSLLVIDRANLEMLGAEDEARLVELRPGDCESVASNFGYPMGRPTREQLAAGRPLGPGSARRMRDAWRLALAVETVGTMDAALSQTVDYLKARRQFGRPIASFQAVQHRLAECSILVEGSRWLAREAAHLGAPAEAVACAAAFALSAAGQVFAETHQLSGAIGFTREHDLHVWSMRLQALRLELGGVSGHRRAIADARWGAARA